MKTTSLKKQNCKCGKVGCLIHKGKHWLKKVMKNTAVNFKKDVKMK